MIHHIYYIKLFLDKIYIVKYETKEAPTAWYRGRVIDIITTDDDEPLYNIFFIDYGNTQILPSTK